MPNELDIANREMNLLIALPIAPILVAGMFVFVWLHETLGWHPLFSGLAALLLVLLCLFALRIWNWFRVLYALVYTVGATALVAYYVDTTYDVMWAIFGGLVTFAVVGVAALLIVLDLSVG